MKPVEENSAIVASGPEAQGSARVREGIVPSRIPELDGLRGLALLCVLLYHYIFSVPHVRGFGLGSLSLGMYSMDVFFVLSGFLIGGITLSTRQSPNYYKTFYARRAYRILPVYASFLALCAIIMWVGPKLRPGSAAVFHADIPLWRYVPLIHNVYWSSHHPQDMAEFQLFAMMLLWSLAVEEHFYLVVPFTVRRLSEATLIRLMIGLAAAAFIIRFLLASLMTEPLFAMRSGFYAAYAWTPARVDGLALGVLIAIIYAQPSGSRLRQWFDRASIMLLAPFALLTYIMDRSTKGVHGSIFSATWNLTAPLTFCLTYSLAVLTATCLIGVLTNQRVRILSRFFQLRFLVQLSRISFCVYIIHGLVNWSVHKIVLGSLPRFDSWQAISVTALGFSLTIGTAMLSWRFFEGPLLERARRMHGYRDLHGMSALRESHRAIIRSGEVAPAVSTRVAHLLGREDDVRS
jgi:peptidoglycan/LPS O-acetylase OafA/YrhL